MYLIDTNVVSEFRKGDRAHPGVIRFAQRAAADESLTFLSIITVGELRRGIHGLRLRGDDEQADRLQAWYDLAIEPRQADFLPVATEVAQVWGVLMARNPKNPLDKLIAATALVYDLTMVTRNEQDFVGTGVKVLNPFD